MNHQENSYYYVINSWNNLAYGGKDVKKKKNELLVSSVFAMPMLCVHPIIGATVLGSVWSWQACLTWSLGQFLWLLGMRVLPCNTIATFRLAVGTVGIIGHCHPLLIPVLGRPAALPLSTQYHSLSGQVLCVYHLRVMGQNGNREFGVVYLTVLSWDCGNMKHC